MSEAHVRQDARERPRHRPRPAAQARDDDADHRRGAAQQNVSKHLGTLHQHGMVDRRRAGTSAVYSIADDGVFALCELVRGGLQQRQQAFAAALGA